MKFILKFYGIILFLFFSTLFTTSAWATFWTLDLYGKVSGITEYLGEISTSNMGEYNFHSDRFHIGQEFFGRITINDEAIPLSTLADDQEKDIYSAVTDSYLNINKYVYQKGVNFPSYVQIWNKSEPNSIKDVFTASGNTYIRPRIQFASATGGLIPKNT